MINLYHGDNTQHLPDNSFELILTDPPYGTTKCIWDTDISIPWDEFNRLLKPRGTIAVFGAQPFTSVVICSNLKQFKYCWVWQKSCPTGHLNAKRMPLKEVEDIMIFNSGNYYPQGLETFDRVVKNSRSDCERVEAISSVTGGIKDQEYLQEHTNYPRTILQFPNKKFSTHPTQKPVDLLQYLIRTYTLPGESVLDCFAGSGSTGIAAENEQRNATLVERNGFYCSKMPWEPECLTEKCSFCDGKTRTTSMEKTATAPSAECSLEMR